MVIERAGLLSSCICILLEWNDERKQLVANLRELGIPMIVLVVGELGFVETLDPGPMKDQPHFFHTLEAGRIEEGLAKL